VAAAERGAVHRVARRQLALQLIDRAHDCAPNRRTGIVPFVARVFPAGVGPHHSVGTMLARGRPGVRELMGRNRLPLGSHERGRSLDPEAQDLAQPSFGQIPLSSAQSSSKHLSEAVRASGLNVFPIRDHSVPREQALIDRHRPMPNPQPKPSWH